MHVNKLNCIILYPKFYFLSVLHCSVIATPALPETPIGKFFRRKISFLAKSISSQVKTSFFS